MLLQKTILQQPSTPAIQKAQTLAMTMDVIGSMLSVPVNALRMPRFLLNTAIYVSKLGQKLARSEWHNYTVLDN